MNLHDFVLSNKINQGHLAALCGMHPKSFRQKLNKQNTLYHFTKKEETALFAELKKYGTGIVAFAETEQLKNNIKL